MGGNRDFLHLKNCSRILLALLHDHNHLPLLHLLPCLLKLSLVLMSKLTNFFHLSTPFQPTYKPRSTPKYKIWQHPPIFGSELFVLEIWLIFFFFFFFVFFFARFRSSKKCQNLIITKLKTWN